jgi:hypothetical protein
MHNHYACLVACCTFIIYPHVLPTVHFQFLQQISQQMKHMVPQTFNRISTTNFLELKFSSYNKPTGRQMYDAMSRLTHCDFSKVYQLCIWVECRQKRQQWSNMQNIFKATIQSPSSFKTKF